MTAEFTEYSSTIRKGKTSGINKTNHNEVSLIPTMFRLAVVLIAALAIGAAKYTGGQGKPSPLSSYPELLAKAKKAFAAHTSGKTVKPESLLFTVDNKRNKKIESLYDVKGPVHTLAVVDSKKRVFLAVIADDEKHGGPKLLYSPVPISSAPFGKESQIDKVQSLVRAGKHAEARKEMARWFEKLKKR